MLYSILGDPGATSRDDAIFLGESLLQELKSPWELILTKPVPEVVEFRPADWAEKIFFCPISDEVQLGNSVAFLHEVVFFIDRPSCFGPYNGKIVVETFRKQIFSEAEEIASLNIGARNQKERK